MENLALVAGLGNPGKEYAMTRHNAGFLALERFAQRWRARWGGAGRFKAELARATVGGRPVVLCKPLTYMNLSGTAVAPVARFYRVPADRILVVLDDADLPLGQIRLRPAGSSGGHHGLESIEEQLGTREYARLRIGIGRDSPGIRQITGHVLGRFAPEEHEWVEKILERVTDQMQCWVSDGPAKAMNQFNGAVTAPAAEDNQ